jgi:hypothetical protein
MADDDDDLPQLSHTPTSSEAHAFLKAAGKSEGLGWQKSMRRKWFGVERAWPVSLLANKHRIGKGEDKDGKPFEFATQIEFTRTEYDLSKEPIRMSVEALRLEPYHDELFLWWNNPARNQYLGYVFTAHLAPAKYVELVEMYPSRLNPGPTKAERRAARKAAKLAEAEAAQQLVADPRVKLWQNLSADEAIAINVGKEVAEQERDEAGQALSKAYDQLAAARDMIVRQDQRIKELGGASLLPDEMQQWLAGIMADDADETDDHVTDAIPPPAKKRGRPPSGKIIARRERVAKLRAKMDAAGPPEATEGGAATFHAPQPDQDSDAN